MTWRIFKMQNGKCSRMKIVPPFPSPPVKRFFLEHICNGFIIDQSFLSTIEDCWGWWTRLLQKKKEMLREQPWVYHNEGIFCLGNLREESCRPPILCHWMNQSGWSGEHYACRWWPGDWADSEDPPGRHRAPSDAGTWTSCRCPMDPVDQRFLCRKNHSFRARIKLSDWCWPWLYYWPTYSPSSVHKRTVQSNEEVSTIFWSSTMAVEVMLSTCPLHVVSTVVN